MGRVAYIRLVMASSLVGIAGIAAAEEAPKAALEAQLRPWHKSGFLENRSQWEGPALFLARSAGAIVRLEPDGLSLAMEGSRAGTEERQRCILGLHFEGAQLGYLPEGEDLLSGAFHFFQGKNRSARRIAAERFSSVIYRDLYPGISIRVKTAACSAGAAPLEYDILAKPGADLRRVVIATEGIEGLRLEPDGSLVLETSIGEIRQPPPIAWTEPASGGSVPTPCAYRLYDGCRYGLEAPAWDGRSPLVIDPVVSWSRFLGGESDDFLFDVKVREADGALIVAGSTRSMTFPELGDAVVSGERNGSLDAVVLCFDASSGELRGAAVLAGELDDEAWSIALGPDADVTVAGHTESPGFPVTNGDAAPSGANAFVARLSADLAELEYSALLGGSGEDRAANVVLGEEGSAWVLGYTDSADFPVTAGCFQEVRAGGRYDLFVTQLRTDEDQMGYSTYFGGSGSEPLDFGARNERLRALGLACDQGGRIYLCGRTDSRDFPTSTGARDRLYGDDFSKGFLTVLAPGHDGAEQLTYSTYLGGTSDGAAALDIALDPSGAVWVAGWTFSSSFPTTANANERMFFAPEYGSSGFLVHLIPDDALAPEEQLDYSTLLTGTSGASSCTLDVSGTVTVTGGTFEAHVPVSACAPGQSLSGGVDSYLTRLDPRLLPLQQHIFSTYLGGMQEDRIYGLATDSAGRAYLVGSSGSVEMQGVAGQSNGVQEGFIAVLDLRIPTAAFTMDGPHDGTLAVDASGSTTPAGTTIESYAWDFGDGATAEGKTASHAYSPGSFPIALTVTNDLGLTSTKSQVVSVPCAAGDVAPWISADIGEPGFPGSATRDGDCFSLCAGGSLLAGKSDKLHFVEKDIAGDFVLTLRIEEVVGPPLGAQLGLMARETLDPGSSMCAIGIYKTAGSATFRLHSRAVPGASITGKNGGTAALPGWVRLERSGDDLIGLASPDAMSWIEIGRVTLEGRPDNLLVGIFGMGREPALGAFEPLQARVCLEAWPPPVRFRRGDADGNGSLEITDAIATLGFLFLGTAAPECRDAADADDSGILDITDAIYSLGYQFLGTAPPPAPGPRDCGEDPTVDALPACTYDPARC